MKFTWDMNKATRNLSKHGVTFEEASTVFADFLSVTVDDVMHSEKEERLLLLGVSVQQRLLVVAHTEQEDVIRIISARQATSRERKQYEQGA